MTRLVVVGASIAGLTTVGALHQGGFDGEIVVIGAEPDAPYTRPPLSKAVLRGDEPLESVALPALPDSVDLRLGVTAESVDVAASTVQLDTGESIRFDGLAIATGSRPRTLRPDGRGETVLRTLSDAASLRTALLRRPTVLIIGGGLIGMEVASTCIDLGLQVTVVDIAQPLTAHLGDDLASVVRARAIAKGVRFTIVSGSIALIGDDPVVGATFADGTSLRADLVLTCIGDVPNVEWLQGSGLPVRPDGVVIDDRCVVVPGIVAAGDAAVLLNAEGQRVRHPHHSNAIDQGRVAANSLLGGPDTRWEPRPYFWTDMFGLSLHVVGSIGGADSFEVVEGDLPDGPAVLVWRRSGVTIGAATVNRRMPLPRLRRMLEADGTQVLQESTTSVAK